MHYWSKRVLTTGGRSVRWSCWPKSIQVILTANSIENSILSQVLIQWRKTAGKKWNLHNVEGPAVFTGIVTQERLDALVASDAPPEPFTGINYWVWYWRGERLVGGQVLDDKEIGPDYREPISAEIILSWARFTHNIQTAKKIAKSLCLDIDYALETMDMLDELV